MSMIINLLVLPWQAFCHIPHPSYVMQYLVSWDTQTLLEK